MKSTTSCRWRIVRRVKRDELAVEEHDCVNIQLTSAGDLVLEKEDGSIIVIFGTGTWMTAEPMREDARNIPTLSNACD